MRFDEYRNLDGVALAKLVADGEVTAAELLELAIARAEAVNPALNGLIIPLYDQAREQAGGRLERPPGRGAHAHQGPVPGDRRRPQLSG